MEDIKIFVTMKNKENGKLCLLTFSHIKEAADFEEKFNRYYQEYTNNKPLWIFYFSRNKPKRFKNIKPVFIK